MNQKVCGKQQQQKKQKDLASRISCVNFFSLSLSSSGPLSELVCTEYVWFMFGTESVELIACAPPRSRLPTMEK